MYVIIYDYTTVSCFENAVYGIIHKGYTIVVLYESNTFVICMYWDGKYN